MKKYLICFLIILLLLDPALAFVGHSSKEKILPNDFSDRVFDHIIQLANLGHRQAGSKNDKLSIQYIKTQFKKNNIDVNVQPFEFESFEYNDLNLKVMDKQIKVIGLGFNPYLNRKEYKGAALLMDLNKNNIQFNQEDIKGKTIITNDWNGHFRLIRFKPALIIYVDSLAFKDLAALSGLQDELKFKLNINCSYKKYRSANIIGKVGNYDSSAKEILVTAHFDTYRRNNPGASDNASGVGILLELARYFKKKEKELNCIVKFVTFGAEEIGVLGSRNYLYNNIKSLQQCELLFNIDDIGGSGPVLVEMNGGVNGVLGIKCKSQIPEDLKIRPWEGIDSFWRILPDDNLMKIFSSSNHPEWLVDVVNRSVKELGYEITPTGTQGSDQLTFAQAGIVTSGIGIISSFSHSPKDIPEEINKKSLKKAGEITAHIVLNTMERIKK